MSTEEAISTLRAFQSQIVHGKNTFGEIADAVSDLKKLAGEQHSMLRAFRLSMDANLPFPSQEKLDAVISQGTHI